jgi:aspartyl-tRNA(Asn)/glutamyl-tRNA(Gln) amidotransferase subunit A
MSIRIKQQEFISSISYWKERTIKLKQLILKDETGAFWHLDETFKKFEKQVKLDSLNAEDKLKLPFAGLSVGVKDLFCVKSMTTTAGSKILEDFVSPYDSTLWKSLSERGAMLGGKLSMDEFAMGSFTNTSFLGRTSIPEFPEHTAGGSSGGSAAAVASGLVDFSIGSDTGGSVRLPASFCGVVGYKPSYGSFSRFGMIPYASSLDQAGFFTKTLDDLQYILEQQISEKDPSDPTCIGLGEYKKQSYKPKAVGYFKELLESKDVQPEVRKYYKRTLYLLDKEGIKLVPVEIDFMKQAAQIYYIIACSEASSNLARYQGVYFGKQLSEEPIGSSFAETISEYRSKYFGKEVQKRIMLGSSILSAENFTEMYEKSWNMRKALTLSIQGLFDTVDFLCLPVSPMSSPKWSDIDKMTSAEIYYSDYMTVPFSLAGVPALSVPFEHFKTSEGLPIGMQFVGKKFEDYKLIDTISELEKSIVSKKFSSMLR